MRDGPALRRVDLDERGLPYLDKVLGDGGDLSHLMLDRLHAEHLHAWTLVPSDVPIEWVYGFTNSLVGRSPGAEERRIGLRAAFQALLDTVDRHLRSSPDAICLFEHVWGSPADGWIRPFDFVIQENGVLLFLTPKTILGAGDLPALETFVRSASTTLFLCVMANDSDWPEWLRRGANASVERLRSITGGRSKAVVRAYDDEGYIYLESGRSE